MSKLADTARNDEFQCEDTAPTMEGLFHLIVAGLSIALFTALTLVAIYYGGQEFARAKAELKAHAAQSQSTTPESVPASGGLFSREVY